MSFGRQWSTQKRSGPHYQRLAAKTPNLRKCNLKTCLIAGCISLNNLKSELQSTLLTEPLVLFCHSRNNCRSTSFRASSVVFCDLEVKGRESPHTTLARVYLICIRHVIVSRLSSTWQPRPPNSRRTPTQPRFLVATCWKRWVCLRAFFHTMYFVCPNY